MVRFQQDIHAYCEANSSPPDAILRELERVTHLRTLSPQMLSGPLQGRFLEMLSRLMQPLRILEIGTFTGYASICLARGLARGGVLHTVEINPELAYISNAFFEKAGLKDRIQAHIADAAHLMPTFPDPFDLIFMDAGKRDYPTHYELALEKLRPGGLLLADNVLWSGKVARRPATDADTQALRDFNAHVQSDPRVSNVLLPLRDGLMLVRKG